MTCDYSLARDCSECEEPYCRRDIYHSPNDWDADAAATFLDCAPDREAYYLYGEYFTD